MSKVFLVTGSSRGLGRSIVTAALSAGHRVLATARRPEQLDDLVAAYGERIVPFALDVTDDEAAQAAVRAAVDRFGRLDVVVNNAGYANVAAIEDVTLQDFRAQLETNLMGVVVVTKAALPVLRAQGSGHVVNISSVGGRLASPGLGAYQTAKWAVGGFSSVLAAEVNPLGVHVTVLEPGGIRTDWAGASMTIHPVSEPYRGTVGRNADRMAASGSSDSLGDPDRMADVLLQVVELDEPPLRLVLGSEALRYATAAARRQAESDERWRELTESTDRADATAAQRDPLARA